MLAPLYRQLAQIFQPSRHRTPRLLVNGLAWALLLIYLLPVIYMVVTAFKAEDQIRDSGAPLWPARLVTYTAGEQAYAVYNVPTNEGVRALALINRHRTYSEFIDPSAPDAGLIHWDGYWGVLPPVYTPYFTLDNFIQLWTGANFLQMVGNTLIILIFAGGGSFIASILVAYGFARFPVPAGRLLFGLLIATILLPEKVTFIPTYFVYVSVLKLNGSWLPLILPHLFGNAVMIFLLRQNLKSIPKDIEEAATLDGAGPVRILTSILLPQTIPSLVTVALLQFFYFWNEARLASLYLSITPERYPVAFWVQNYFDFIPLINLTEASAVMVMVIPVLLLALAQRGFMQGVLVTGTEK